MRAQQLLRGFLSGRPTETRLAYERDLNCFAAFIQATDSTAAIATLLAAKQAQANALALSYRAHLLETVSASSVNRRLSALRSLVRMARQWGLTSITIEVKGCLTTPLRDSRGPTLRTLRKLFATANKRKGFKAARNRAILHLLYGLALRKNEACSLDLEHVDLLQGVVLVMGKGRTQREALSLPSTVRRALAAWIKVRGQASGPLFVVYGRRLSGRTVNQMMHGLAKEAGIAAPIRPHGLRHAAITEALEATKGDVRRVQKFSRHKSLDMLLVYDDARRDLGGEVAELVSKRLRGRL